ncbi:hypothetical protein AB0E12_25265 [Micromonospora chersina]|uniref:hypothetical protein n=1 Tax=Micromonospora chersina TaxID=47854 RepID=UPI0033C425FB
MRRLAIALAAGGIAAIGVAAPAQADPGLNYGHCVSAGLVEPSDGTTGPAKINPQGKITGAYNAASHKPDNGKSHFDGWALCPKG